MQDMIYSLNLTRLGKLNIYILQVIITGTRTYTTENLQCPRWGQDYSLHKESGIQLPMVKTINKSQSQGNLGTV
jgi:hypothetical protein